MGGVEASKPPPGSSLCLLNEFYGSSFQKKISSDFPCRATLYKMLNQTIFFVKCILKRIFKCFIIVLCCEELESAHIDLEEYQEDTEGQLGEIHPKINNSCYKYATGSKKQNLTDIQRRSDTENITVILSVCSTQSHRYCSCFVHSRRKQLVRMDMLFGIYAAQVVFRYLHFLFFICFLLKIQLNRCQIIRFFKKRNNHPRVFSFKGMYEAL